jgi:hypothetical protein
VTREAPETKAVPISDLHSIAGSVGQAREDADRILRRLSYLLKWAASRRHTEDFCNHVRSIQIDVVRLHGDLESPSLIAQELIAEDFAG